jgi:hypothetical protein
MIVATPTLPKICGAGLGCGAGIMALPLSAANSAKVRGLGGSVMGRIGSTP